MNYLVSHLLVSHTAKNNSSSKYSKHVAWLCNGSFPTVLTHKVPLWKHKNNSNTAFYLTFKMVFRYLEYITRSIFEWLTTTVRIYSYSKFSQAINYYINNVITTGTALIYGSLQLNMSYTFKFYPDMIWFSKDLRNG